MTDRYYIDPKVSKIDAEKAILAGDEAHHLIRVMRAKVGDNVTLFDGTGSAFQGIVESIQKHAAIIAIAKCIPDTIESNIRLTIGSALPKGDRQRFLIEKLAELGAARFVPLKLDRSVAKLGDSGKLDRYVIESAKQCGRNMLMEVTEEMSLKNFCELTRSEDGMSPRYILHPVSLGSVGQVRADALHIFNAIPKQEPLFVTILVGPEGSFTDDEVTLALREGFIPLDLGARILRTETACIAASALFLCGA